MKNVIITSVLALMLATGANAKNIYVSPDGSASNNGESWNSPISDLGTAYSKASKGDVIYMAGGTYMTTTTINMVEGVHVYGGFAKGETSIENRVRPNAATEPWKFTNETIITSGNQTFRLVDRVDKDNFWDNTIVDGITFKNNVSTDGRVLYLRNSVTLQNCQILDNACTNTVVYGEENTIVRDCYFSGNNTSNPEKEAVTLQLRGCHSEYFPGNQLYDCVFEGNKVPSLSIYNTAEQVSDQDGTLVTNCIFRNNVSSCIQINNQWAKRYLKITHCLFEGNTSSNIGTVLSGNSEVYYDFAFNIIRNNTNATPAGESWRNAIIATKKNAQIENCLIVNNSSENLLIDLQGSTIYNNTIANNKGTVYVGESYATVMNSIMVNNQATHNNKAVYAIDNSAVRFCASDIEITNSSTDSNTPAFFEDNIIEAAPFVKSTTFVGSTTDAANIQAIKDADFSLTSNSACVNTGSVDFIDEFFMTQEWIDEFMNKDIAGNERIVDGKINMGAYQGGKGTGINNTSIEEGMNCNVIVDGGMIYISSEKDGYVTLYNVNGAMVASTEIVGGNASIPAAQKGLCLVKVITGNQVKTFRVVIK